MTLFSDLSSPPRLPADPMSRFRDLGRRQVSIWRAAQVTRYSLPEGVDRAELPMRARKHRAAAGAAAGADPLHEAVFVLERGGVEYLETAERPHGADPEAGSAGAVRVWVPEGAHPAVDALLADERDTLDYAPAAGLDVWVELKDAPPLEAAVLGGPKCLKVLPVERQTDMKDEEPDPELQAGDGYEKVRRCPRLLSRGTSSCLPAGAAAAAN